MKELVEIASSIPLASKNNKQHVMLGLLLSCMEVVQDLSETGMMEEDDLAYAAKVAAEITSKLAYRMVGCSILNDKNVMIFEGFTSMDMVVKVLEESEIYESEVKVWLTG